MGSMTCRHNWVRHTHNGVDYSLTSYPPQYVWVCTKCGILENTFSPVEPPSDCGECKDEGEDFYRRKLSAVMDVLDQARYICDLDDMDEDAIGSDGIVKWLQKHTDVKVMLEAKDRCVYVSMKLDRYSYSGLTIHRMLRNDEPANTNLDEMYESLMKLGERKDVNYGQR